MNNDGKFALAQTFFGRLWRANNDAKLYNDLCLAIFECQPQPLSRLNYCRRYALHVLFYILGISVSVSLMRNNGRRFEWRQRRERDRI